MENAYFNPEEYQKEIEEGKRLFYIHSKPYFDLLCNIMSIKPYRAKFVKNDFTGEFELVNLNQPDTPEEIECKKTIDEIEQKYLGKFLPIKA